MKSTTDISASGHRHKRSPCSWKSKKSMESTSTCPFLSFQCITPGKHTLGSTAFVAAVVLEGGGVVSGCPRGGGGGGETERRVCPQRNLGRGTGGGGGGGEGCGGAVSPTVSQHTY